MKNKIIATMIMGMALMISNPITVSAVSEQPQETVTETPAEAATEATTEAVTNDVQMGKAYIKALYSSDIEMAADDIFVITYAVIGYTDVAKITVDASTITETTEIEMPVADYFVDKIEYQGNNAQIKTQGYGATLKFNAAPKGGSILYISIGQEQNDYLDETYEETYIIDDKHSNGPLNDPLDGRFVSNESTEFQYTTEDIDWDMEYDDNYGVEDQIQDATQKPEIEHYKDVDEESTEEVKEEKKEGSSINFGKLIFALLLFGGAGFVLWKINNK